MKRTIGPIPGRAGTMELTLEEIATFEEYPDVDRPKVRSDCWDFEKDAPIGTRPCPFVTCRYNNFCDIGPGGTIFKSWPNREPWDVPANESCALDIMENEHPMSDGRLAEIMGLSKRGAQEQVYRAQRHARQIRSRLLRVIK